MCKLAINWNKLLNIFKISNLIQVRNQWKNYIISTKSRSKLILNQNLRIYNRFNRLQTL